MGRSVKNICFTLFVLFFSVSGFAQSPAEYKSTQAAVASAHPLATRAGITMLQQGGNAFDAAIAVTAALAVVEPYSSGIGGGGFYLLHQVENDRHVMIDARERAPLRAHRDIYLDEQGEVIPGASITGASAAGIPGIPAALVHLADNYGNLKLADSLAPAISYAVDGFPVDEYYQRMAGFRLKDLQKNKAASELFLQQNEIPELGYKIVQKDLASTLKTIAASGYSGFYENELAWKMVRDVRKNGGIWTMKDLATYQVKERSPDIVIYKGMKLVSASLPSSGGLVLSEILQMLAEFDLEKVDEAQRVHLIAEAMRRAYRDRGVRPELHKIVVALSGSPKDELMIHWLGGFKLRPNVEVHLVRVLQLHTFYRQDIRQKASEYWESSVKQAQSQILKLETTVQAMGLTTETHLVEGDHIAESLIDYAEQHGCDLLMTGDSDSGLLTRVFLGSTSRYVLRHAECSVVIVRDKEDRRRAVTEQAALEAKQRLAVV